MTTSLQTRLGTAPEEAMKAPCVVSTTANITLSGEQTIDSVAVVAGDRVLVRSQTDGSENGIYVVSTGAWTRATDWNNANDVISGQIVPDANSGVQYQASFSGTMVIGTTSVTFSASSVVSPIYFGIAAGTADVMTVALDTTVLALTEGLEIRVRALGANTVLTPTIAVDGLAAKTIVKNGNQALVLADIPRADYEMTLRYNSGNDVFELLNPHLIASGVSVTPAGALVATDVQAALEELDADLTTHINDATDVHAASATTVTPAGNIVATDVQAALEELDAEKALLAGSTGQAFAVETLAFPATQVPSADPNTLDDYEEIPSFTPALQGSTTPGTPGGTYTGLAQKIGNRVFFDIQIQVSTSLGGMVGNVEISLGDLVYTPSGSAPLPSVTIGRVIGGNFTAGYAVQGVFDSNGDIQLQLTDTAGGVSALLVSEITTTFLINLSGSFTV